MDLATAADLAEVLGAATIAGGALFAAVQIHHLRAQRRDAAALTFIQGWSQEDLAALDVVYGLPDGAPPETIDADPSIHRAAFATYNNFELLGLMVHQRLVPIATANDWAGGGVRVAWRKLRPWIEAKRAQSGSARPGEWFQWLAERLAEIPARDERVGAYVAHAKWRP